MSNKDIRGTVRKRYGEIASAGGSCCSSGCGCGGNAPRELSGAIGYTEAEMDSVPDGSNLGLGCGNPVALASLKRGENVLDLGSGAGFDCFLAAEAVGGEGHVIGVDMTPEMLKRARENAMKGGFKNFEFRKWNIENLPLEGDSVDVVISNCVINLSPEKDKVFSEAFRVLRPGGRLMVSDIVLDRELPPALRNSITGHIACLSGADLRTIYLDRIGSAGFSNIEVQGESVFSLENLGDEATIDALMSESGLTRERLSEVLKGVKSIKVRAERPFR